MPYVIRIGGSDSRSMDKVFDPDIPMDFKRILTGVYPMTPEARAAIPKTLLVGKPRKGGVSAVLGWSMGPFIVSQRVHDILEELEPGVQDFVPVEVKSLGGVPIGGKTEHGTYYLLLPLPQVDAIVAEETDFSGKLIDIFGKCTVDLAAVGSHHLWRAPDPYGFIFFCSDQLHDRLEAEGLDGWSFQKCKGRLGVVGKGAADS